MSEKKRYEILDAVRGFALINMILYHALWDVVYIFGVDIPWYYAAPGRIWQQLICHTFIFLSGFCFPFGKRKLKRAVITLGASVIISVVTAIVMPQTRILFGVLCLIGSAILIMIPFEKLFKKLNPYIGFVIFVALYIYTKINITGSFVWGNLFTSYIGFPSYEFYSSDYFPLVPWLFLFVSGFFMNQILSKHNMLKYLGTIRIKPLEWMGRHSLIIYMLHQPVIYGLLLIIFMR